MGSKRGMAHPKPATQDNDCWSDFHWTSVGGHMMRSSVGGHRPLYDLWVPAEVLFCGIVSLIGLWGHTLLLAYGLIALLVDEGSWILVIVLWVGVIVDSIVSRCVILCWWIVAWVGG